jgi:hypothetical protein
MLIDGALVEAAGGATSDNGSVGINGCGWYAPTPRTAVPVARRGRHNGLEGFEQHLETKAAALGRAR